ncbi:type 4a pilus biogenesis protein PilO [Halalkalibacterium ligniniphilum]|uniref:type 4a pilus biogenesis protein PilO n=1 Tax=Halalkalibacterium ligniniphilum TaxID=1134413 RepID=UPI00034A0FD5|nr:type 4a pilus biogenesis protein PilO [Halalkalibacterium ligniniphilum]
MKRHTYILGAFFILCALAGVIFYRSFIQPLQNEQQQLVRSLENGQQLLAEVERHAAVRETEQPTSYQLQQKLPVKPLLDQFVLLLGRAESLSNTRLVSVQMNDPIPMEAESASIQFNEEISEGIDGQDPRVLEEPNVESEKSAPQMSSSLPTELDFTNVRRIQAQLIIQVSSYEELRQFLAELEQLPRITEIERVSVRGWEEQVEVGEERDMLEVDVAVSTFYYEGLDELAEEAPSYEYPEQEKKQQPFYE